ncbi:MAG TPA: 2-keto-4-pentenoate hydratase [Ilumatobacteraceae bacterium]|jgi:2-keto-4-pentenoate hydratase
MDPTLLAQVALLLRDAERESAPIPPLIATWPQLAIDDAYRIQQINIEDRIAGGDFIVGHKVGLSSLAMQRMMGVDQPDFGHLLGSMEVPNGAAVDAATCIALRVEVEVAFVLGSPLSGPDCTVEDVLAATVEFRPAIELIDSRIADWKIGISDTIADNASSKGFVLGEPIAANSGIDSRMVPAVLWLNDEIIETGVSAAVLGHPARAVAWLANTLHRFGTTLEAGHVILPGSCTKAVGVKRGDRVRAEFGPLGDVSVSFSEEGVAL